MSTPYTAASHHPWGQYFASHGFATAIVDVRGRGDSDGEFDPWSPSPDDGYDVVEWLAGQEFSTGRVGSFGGSFTGLLQWVAARRAPPHLVSMAPFASVGLGLDFPVIHGTWDSYLVQWLSYVGGKTNSSLIFKDDDYWAALGLSVTTGETAFLSADREAVGRRIPAFQRALEHPSFDEFWRRTYPTTQEYARMRIPMLTVTGAYDVDQAGAFEYYRGQTRNVSADVAARHFMVIGPWNHSGAVGEPKASFDGGEFGPASVIDKKGLLREWFAWTMQGGPRPSFLKGRVAAYVAVADEWRYAPTVESLTQATKRLFMSGETGCGRSLSTACPLIASGPPERFEAEWTSDPMDPREALAIRKPTETSLADTRDLEALHGEALVFETPAVEADMTILGRCRVSVPLGADVPDFDVRARIYEIDEHGRSLLLGSSLMRAKFRRGIEKPQNVAKAVVETYELADFNVLGRKVAKGRRLRLVLGTNEGPGVVPNPQSGANFGATKDEFRRAVIRVVADAKNPAFLELPLGG